MVEHGEQFRVRAMCQVLGVSRSSYYRWRHAPEGLRAREDRKLLVEIRTVNRRNRSRYGSPRIYRALKQGGIRCGKHRVERLMRRDGLRARVRRSFRVTTRWPRILWIGSSRWLAWMRSGRATSPTFGPRKDGSTWPHCWTSAPGGWWVGPVGSESFTSWRCPHWTWPCQRIGATSLDKIRALRIRADAQGNRCHVPG